MRLGSVRGQYSDRLPRWPLLILVIALALVFGAAAPVCAHTLSESLSAWRIDGDTVRLQFTVPDLEAKRVTPSGKDQPSSAELGRYLAERVGASSADRKCPLSEGPRALAASVGYFRYELVFKCPAATDIKIRSAAFYDLVKSHTNFARI